MPNEKSISPARMPIAGLLAWLVPGLGHIYLGLRGRGAVCLVTITATFWTGVAIGGVRGTVDPKERKLWFIAQLCSAANAVAAYGLDRSNAHDRERGGEGLEGVASVREGTRGRPVGGESPGGHRDSS